jgi:large subunit ribosomal protein L4
MALVNVVNWKNEKVSTIELKEEIFSVEVKNEVLHEVVQWQLAKRRSGTHMVKTRSLVSGGGKKPFKQKGTGNARQGSSRSPLMPGGAKLFGPVPRSYEFSLPKKVRRLALSMALSYLNKQGKLRIVDSLKSEGKTAELSKRLKTFGAGKAVLVDAGPDEMFKRAASNLKNFKYLTVDGVNVFDLLKYDFAILSKDSVSSLVNRCEME